MRDMTRDSVTLVDALGCSLAESCGPVVWGGNRWPDQRWVNGELVCVKWERGEVIHRIVSQPEPATLSVSGSLGRGDDAAWLHRVLRLDDAPQPFADLAVERLRGRFPGLRSVCGGSLWDGLVTSIVGQSISVAAAATVTGRVCTLFSEPVLVQGVHLLPLPTPQQLAGADVALVRSTGVTTRRAEALVDAGRAFSEGAVPTDNEARTDPMSAAAALRSLTLVGPWTAHSALLWGVGAADAHPSGDVALLRAWKLAGGRPDATLRDLDQAAEAWRPWRAMAARLLWTNLFGTAVSAIA